MMLTKVEILRKIVHLATLIIPIGYALTSEKTAILFLIPFFIALLAVDFIRQIHSGMGSLFEKYFFGRVLREEEKSDFMGSTYFIFSTILTILLFPQSIAIASLFILILADTAAALIGKGIGKVKVFGKTVEGSAAFLITSLLIVWIYPDLNRLSGSLAALGATIVEILPIKVNDNLSIPLVAGAIMFFAAG